MRPIVLFGTGKIAEVVRYYMTASDTFEIVAFTCNGEYIDSETWCERPVVPFETVENSFPPDKFGMFIALGYQELNSVRAARVREAKEKGYELVSFVHEDAGLPHHTELGENCFVMNNVLVQPKVSLGNNVFLWSGALVGHHSSIGDNCWITSTASICGVVTVGTGCFFAANATVANNVRIGDDCFLGANTLVTKDLPDSSVVIAKSSDVLRLTSQQFLKMSKFS